MITLPIQVIRFNDDNVHLMVEADFNHEHKGCLVIDTGASKTVIDESFVNDIVKDVEEIETEESSGINGQISGAKTGIIPQLGFGKLVLKNYKCLMLDLSHINSIYEKMGKPRIAGLVGSDFLIKYGAIINYKKRTLTLYQRKQKVVD